MTRGAVFGSRPKGCLRALLRAPVLLFRLRLGWLFAGRLLMIEHVGRTSGRRYRTVLEVVRHDRQAGSWVVASGWGASADWLRNIRKTPEVVLHVGLRRRPARAVVLPEDVGARELCDYAHRHPRAFNALTRFMVGEALETSAEGCRRLAAAVPVVAFAPRARE